MVAIGRRDTLVTLEKLGFVENEHGEEIPAWSPLDGGAEPTTEWAAVYYGRGDERRQAASEQASQTATFGMYSNERTALLTTRDRIVFNGEWDIHAIAPDTPRRGEVEVTATRLT